MERTLNTPSIFKNACSEFNKAVEENMEALLQDCTLYGRYAMSLISNKCSAYSSQLAICLRA